MRIKTGDTESSVEKLREKVQKLEERMSSMEGRLDRLKVELKRELGGRFRK